MGSALARLSPARCEPIEDDAHIGSFLSAGPPGCLPHRRPWAPLNKRKPPTCIATRAAGMISSTLMEDRSDTDRRRGDGFSGVPHRGICLLVCRLTFRKGREERASMPSLVRSSSNRAGNVCPTSKNLKWK